MSRVLVVANQTLAGEELLDAIGARMAKDTCEFTLVVPATSLASRDPSTTLVPGVGVPGHTTGPQGDVEDAHADAQRRLEAGISAIQRLGATVDGDVGDPDPMAAIQEVLARRQFDEIILSTLPSGVSRWLRQDLPHKVERKFQLPVSVVTAQRTRTSAQQFR
jgi:GABA permease